MSSTLRSALKTVSPWLIECSARLPAPWLCQTGRLGLREYEALPAVHRYPRELEELGALVPQGIVQ